MSRSDRWKKPAALLGFATALGLHAAALGLLIAALGLFAVAPAFGQEEDKKGFRDVVELKRLLEVAREAGFSEKEMRAITIEDEEGNVINVWDYLEEVERRKRLEAEKRKAQKEKIYLTVQDVFAELKKDEPADLTRLREKMPLHP